MPFMNYSTKVPAAKTVGEIMQLLNAHGASSVTIDFDDDKDPTALRFTLKTPHGPMPFKLSANVDGIFARLGQEATAKLIRREYVNYPQAYRTAWRVLKDWTLAQIAVIESNLMAPDEAFFQYIVTPGGTTVYEEFKSHGMKLLNP